MHDTTNYFYLAFIYTLYGVVGVTILICMFRLVAFSQSVKRLGQIAMVVFTLPSNIRMGSVPDDTKVAVAVIDETLLRDILQLTFKERAMISIFWLPYATVCLAVVIAMPFLFHMIIPTSVAIVLSLMVGGLFAFIATKDVRPEWLVATEEAVGAILAAEIEVLKQIQTQLQQPQLNEQE